MTIRQYILLATQQFARKPYRTFREWLRDIIPFEWRQQVVTAFYIPNKTSRPNQASPMAVDLPGVSAYLIDPPPPTHTGKAVIIIVSYHNLHYLRLCLQSIWTRTSYPNFEVIVVDNGSDLDVIEYLKAHASQEPRLKVILNGANLGFARANNIGIRAAQACDYIIFLNNDVIVTPGWLSKIIDYLDDPLIGLIGPVTNWAGNEARIEVDYQRIEALDRFAVEYKRTHAGQSFDIPMLALHCVGTRKSLLDEIGLLDERFGIGMFEDDDLAMRARQAGYRVICAEDIYVHHWGQASFGALSRFEYMRLFRENRKKFEAKWNQKWRPHQYRTQFHA
jgi:GT2 family glycosyltransferase